MRIFSLAKVVGWWFEGLAQESRAFSESAALTTFARVNITDVIPQFKQRWTEEISPDAIEKACRDEGMTWNDSLLNPVVTIQIFFLEMKLIRWLRNVHVAVAILGTLPCLNQAPAHAMARCGDSHANGSTGGPIARWCVPAWPLGEATKWAARTGTPGRPHSKPRTARAATSVDPPAFRRGIDSR